MRNRRRPRDHQVRIPVEMYVGVPKTNGTNIRAEESELGRREEFRQAIIDDAGCVTRI